MSRRLSVSSTHWTFSCFWSGSASCPRVRFRSFISCVRDWEGDQEPECVDKAHFLPLLTCVCLILESLDGVTLACQVDAWRHVDKQAHNDCTCWTTTPQFTELNVMSSCRPIKHSTTWEVNWPQCDGLTEYGFACCLTPEYFTNIKLHKHRNVQK